MSPFFSSLKKPLTTLFSRPTQLEQIFFLGSTTRLTDCSYAVDVGYIVRRLLQQQQHLGIPETKTAYSLLMTTSTSKYGCEARQSQASNGEFFCFSASKRNLSPKAGERGTNRGRGRQAKGKGKTKWNRIEIEKEKEKHRGEKVHEIKSFFTFVAGLKPPPPISPAPSVTHNNNINNNNNNGPSPAKIRRTQMDTSPSSPQQQQQYPTPSLSSPPTSSFAAALRNLAKNATVNSTKPATAADKKQRTTKTHASPQTNQLNISHIPSSLLDVRKVRV